MYISVTRFIIILVTMLLASDIVDVTEIFWIKSNVEALLVTLSYQIALVVSVGIVFKRYKYSDE